MNFIKTRRDVLRSIAVGTALGMTATEASAAPKKIQTRPFVITPDGTHLYYQDWGNGKTILFVAPWALTSNWWEYQVPYLSTQGFRCIAYDRRGHGRSDWPSHGYDFDTLAGDMSALMRHLDLRDIIIVAHSMGCAEAVRYVARYNGERVSKIVLIATITPMIMKAPDHPEGVDRKLLEDGRMKLRKDRPHQIADAAASFFNARENAVSSEIMEWWTRMIVDQVSMQTMLMLNEAFTETDFRGDLKKITKPVLLIHGDKDVSALVDFTSRRTAALLSKSDLKIYEGAAHGLPVTHMDKLNEDIKTFGSY